MAEPTTSDGELVARFRAGDEAAFEELFGRYGGMVRAVSARVLGGGGGAGWQGSRPPSG